MVVDAAAAAAGAWCECVLNYLLPVYTFVVVLLVHVGSFFCTTDTAVRSTARLRRVWRGGAAAGARAVANDDGLVDGEGEQHD